MFLPGIACNAKESVMDQDASYNSWLLSTVPVLYYLKVTLTMTTHMHLQYLMMVSHRGGHLSVSWGKGSLYVRFS